MDITSELFHASEEGLDPLAVHRTMHVKKKDGGLALGVDAFIAIWAELPALRFLVPLASFRPIHFLLELFYDFFSRIRPYLPRKSCENSPFCESKK
jgi:predicted DCC family thiol-disulfide oxidoreductase YuxK